MVVMFCISQEVELKSGLSNDDQQHSLGGFTHGHIS